MLLKFEVYRDGRWWGARALGHAIFTQARTLDKLYENIKEAVALHFEEELKVGATLQILVITEIGVESTAALRKPESNMIPFPPTGEPDEEARRRKVLVKHLVKMRDELPPLGMTTAELVHLAREERTWLYES
jgi:predicted RNase H-like HicB family nuclease